jgi:hypothetical protein
MLACAVVMCQFSKLLRNRLGGSGSEQIPGDKNHERREGEPLKGRAEVSLCSVLL